MASKGPNDVRNAVCGNDGLGNSPSETCLESGKGFNCSVLCLLRRLHVFDAFSQEFTRPLHPAFRAAADFELLISLRVNLLEHGQRRIDLDERSVEVSSP